MKDEESGDRRDAEEKRTAVCKQCGSSCFEDFTDSEGRLALVCCECGAPLVVLDAAVDEVFF